MKYQSLEEQKNYQLTDEVLVLSILYDAIQRIVESPINIKMFKEILDNAKDVDANTGVSPNKQTEKQIFLTEFPIFSHLL